MKKNYIAPNIKIVQCDLHEVILAASSPATTTENTDGASDVSGDISGAKKYSAWDTWEE